MSKIRYEVDKTFTGSQQDYKTGKNLNWDFVMELSFKEAKKFAKELLKQKEITGVRVVKIKNLPDNPTPEDIFVLFI